MLNAGKVNAGSSYFSPQYFCEFFSAFATIPRFQNPVKYKRNSRLNPDQDTGPPPAAMASFSFLPIYINTLPLAAARTCVSGTT
jgi:hypothetical protein